MRRIFLSTLCLIFTLWLPLHGQLQKGTASFYADKFEGKSTASGEKYKHNKLTAAHKTLPFGTIIKVINLANNETVEVRINDRGPFIEGRIIDVSRSAAEKLKFLNQGLTEVEIEVIDAGDGRTSSNRPIQIDRDIDTRSYFSLKVEQEEPSGFGVQIGSYQAFDNMLRLTENLKKSYKSEVTIEIKELNGQKIYAIILGSFSSRKKASKFKSQIDERFPTAFIKQF